MEVISALDFSTTTQPTPSTNDCPPGRETGRRQHRTPLRAATRGYARSIDAHAMCRAAQFNSGARLHPRRTAGNTLRGRRGADASQHGGPNKHAERRRPPH